MSKHEMHVVYTCCRKFPFSESAGVGVQTVVCVVCWGEEEKDA